MTSPSAPIHDPTDLSDEGGDHGVERIDGETRGGATKVVFRVGRLRGHRRRARSGAGVAVAGGTGRRGRSPVARRWPGRRRCGPAARVSCRHWARLLRRGRWRTGLGATLRVGAPEVGGQASSPKRARISSQSAANSASANAVRIACIASPCTAPNRPSRYTVSPASPATRRPGVGRLGVSMGAVGVGEAFPVPHQSGERLVVVVDRRVDQFVERLGDRFATTQGWPAPGPAHGPGRHPPARRQQISQLPGPLHATSPYAPAGRPRRLTPARWPYPPPDRPMPVDQEQVRRSASSTIATAAASGRPGHSLHLDQRRAPTSRSSAAPSSPSSELSNSPASAPASMPPTVNKACHIASPNSPREQGTLT